MLTKVEVRTAQGTMLSFPFRDSSSGFLVQDIEGLDPVDAVLVSSSFSGADGEQYHSSRRDKRNIVLKLGLRPDYIGTTAETLRKSLYKFFMPGRQISMRFYNEDGLEVDIVGRVESFPSPMFVQQLDVEISIICFKPDFIDITPVVVTGSTVETTDEFDLDYIGDVPTGIVFELNLNRAESAFTIYHRAPDNTMRVMDVSASMMDLDVLSISTIPGIKGASLTRGGVISSLLYAITPVSNWIQLEPGLNHIRVYATGAAIPFTITYTNRYGGL